jgi:glucuronosyltransferase
VPLYIYFPVPFNFFDTRDDTIIGKTRVLWNSGISHCVTVLQHPEVQKLIHSKHHHFDAIIVEAFSNECFMGFAHKFNAAIIQICPFGGTHWMGEWVGNPNPYSYIPDIYLHYSHHMNFLERLVNTLYGVYWRIGQEFYSIPKQEAVMKQFFNFTESVPSLAELLRKTSLLLVNNHFSLNYPKPLMPNIIEVGGIHLQPPTKLPEVRHVTATLKLMHFMQNVDSEKQRYFIIESVPFILPLFKARILQKIALHRQDIP